MMSEKRADCVDVKMLTMSVVNLQGGSESEGQENFKTIDQSDTYSKTQQPSRTEDEHEQEYNLIHNKSTPILANAFPETELTLEKGKLESQIADAKVDAETEQDREKQLYRQNTVGSECDGEYLVVDQLCSSQNSESEDIESITQTFYTGASRITIQSENVSSDIKKDDRVEQFSHMKVGDKSDHSYHKSPDKSNLHDHVYMKRQNSNEKVCNVESPLKTDLVEKKMDADNTTECEIQTDKRATCCEDNVVDSENQRSGKVSSIVEQTNVIIFSEQVHTTGSKTCKSITAMDRTKMNESCTHEIEQRNIAVERKSEKTLCMTEETEETNMSLGTKENDETKNHTNSLCSNTTKVHHTESEGTILAEKQINESTVENNETCSYETKNQTDGLCSNRDKVHYTSDATNVAEKQINESTVEANVSDHANKDSSIVPCSQTFYTEGMAVTIESNIFEESIGTDKITLCEHEVNPAESEKNNVADCIHQPTADSLKVANVASSDTSDSITNVGDIESAGPLIDSKTGDKKDIEPLSRIIPDKGMPNSLAHVDHLGDGENDLWKANKVVNKTVAPDADKIVSKAETDANQKHCRNDETGSTQISLCSVLKCVPGTTPDVDILGSDNRIDVHLGNSEENNTITNENQMIELNCDGLSSAELDQVETKGDGNDKHISVDNKISEGSSEYVKSSKLVPDHAISDVQVMKENYANLQTNKTRNVHQSQNREIGHFLDSSRENIVSDKNIMKRIYTPESEEPNMGNNIRTTMAQSHGITKKTNAEVWQLPETSSVDQFPKTSKSIMNFNSQSNHSLKNKEINLHNTTPVCVDMTSTVPEEINNTDTNSRPVLAKPVSECYDKEKILCEGDSWKKIGLSITTCSSKTSMGDIHLEKNGTLFSCLRCCYSSNMQPKFEEHLAFHIIAEPYICLACRKTFMGRKQVDAHIANVHSTETVQCGLRASSKIKEILHILDEKSRHNFVGRIKWKDPIPEKEMPSNLDFLPSKTLETSDIQVESGRNGNFSNQGQQSATAISLLPQHLKTLTPSSVGQLRDVSAPSKPFAAYEVSRLKNTQVVKPLSNNNGKATQLVRPVAQTPISIPLHTTSGVPQKIPAQQVIPVSAVGQNSFGAPVMLLNLPTESSQHMRPQALAYPASRVLVEQQPVFLQENGATILTQPSIQPPALLRMSVSLVPVQMTQNNISNVTSNIPATVIAEPLRGPMLQPYASVTNSLNVKSILTTGNPVPILVPATGHSKSSNSTVSLSTAVPTSSFSISTSDDVHSSFQKSNTKCLTTDQLVETGGKSVAKPMLDSPSNNSHDENSKATESNKGLNFRYVKKDCAYICYTCKKVTQQELTFRKHVHHHMHRLQSPVCTCGKKDFNLDDQCTSVKNVVNGIYDALELPTDLNKATFAKLRVQKTKPIKGDLIIISDSDDDDGICSEYSEQNLNIEKQSCGKSPKSDSGLSNNNTEELTALKIVSTYSLSGIDKQQKRSDCSNITQNPYNTETSVTADTTDEHERTVELDIPDTRDKTIKEAIKMPGNNLKIKMEKDGDGQTILHLTDTPILSKLLTPLIIEDTDAPTVDVRLDENVDEKNGELDKRSANMSAEHQQNESTYPWGKFQEKNAVANSKLLMNDETLEKNLTISQAFEKPTDAHSFGYGRCEVPTSFLSSIATLKDAVYEPARTISNESERSFYVCGFSDCVFACLTSADFRTHLNISHKNASEYICAHCSHQSFTEDFHLRHLFNHSNSRTFVLFICGFKQCKFGTNLIHLFRDHMIKFHPLEKDFRCAACKELCWSLDRLVKHLQDNLLKFIQCPYCSVKDGNRKVVLTHISSAHPGKAKQITVASQLICQDKKINLHSRKTPTPPSAASVLKADAKAAVDNLLNPENVNSLKQRPASQTKHTDTDAVPSIVKVDGTRYEPSLKIMQSKSSMKINTRMPQPKTPLDSSLKFLGRSQNHLNVRKVPLERHANSLQCDQCSYIAWNSVRLAEHKSLHGCAQVASAAFHCIYCPMTLDRLSRYKSHLSSHTGNHKITVYSCCHCAFKCNQSAKIESHVQHNHRTSGQLKNVKMEKILVKSTVIACSQCPYLTRCQKDFDQHLNDDHSNLRKHEDIVTADKSINDSWIFKKGISDKGKRKPGSAEVWKSTDTSSESNASQDHLLENNEKCEDPQFDKRFHCMYCMEQFCLLVHLKKHLMGSHESRSLADGLTMFHCKACKNFYSTKYFIVLEHFRKIHPAKKIDIETKTDSIGSDSDEGQSSDGLADRFHCEMCSSTFKWRTELIEHRTKYHKKAHASRLPASSPTIAPFQLSHKRSGDNAEDTFKTKMMKFSEEASRMFVTTPEAEKQEKPKSTKFHLGGDDLHEKLELCFECNDKGFICLICRVIIVKKDVLHRHLLQHLRISFYKCFYCDFECLDFSTIVPHISQEHKKQVRCVHLDLHDIDERVQQGLQNLGVTLVETPNCDDQKAVTAGSPNKQSKTPQGKQSSLKHGVSQERHIVLPSRKYKCSYCKEITDSKPAIKRHIRSSHKGKGVTFSTLSSIPSDECLSVVEDKAFERTTVSPSKRGNKIEEAKTPTKQKNNLTGTTKESEEIGQVTEKGTVQINVVYRCLDCGIKTNSKSSMYTHFSKDKCNNPWYQCGHCHKFKSALKKTVASHISVRHKGKPLKIEILPLIYKSKKCILPSNAEISRSTEFDKLGKSGACFKSNVKSNTSVKCDSCNYSTSSLTELEQHIEHNHPDADWTCKFCNFEERNLNLLKRHCRSKHNKNLAFSLTVVGESDYSNDEYDAESSSGEEAETSESPKEEYKRLSYICRFCRVSYDNRSKFWNHLRTHFGYKPFVCTYCKLKLSARSVLNKHIHSKHPGCPFELKYTKNKSVEKMLNAIIEYCCSKSKKCSDPLPADLMFFHRSDKNEYVCLKCEKISQSDGIMELHVVNKHKACKRKKDENNSETKTENDQKIEKRIVSKENNKSFESKEKVEPNWKTDDNEGQPKYTCITCGVEKNSLVAMKYHQYTHSPIKYKCLHCGYVSCPRSLVAKHIRNVHKTKDMQIKEVSISSPSQQKHVESDLDERKVNLDSSVRIAPLPKLRHLPTNLSTKLDIDDSDDSVSSIFTSERSSDELDDDEAIDRQSSISSISSSNTGKIIYCCSECKYQAANLFHFRQHLTQHKGFTKLTTGIGSDSRLRCGYCSYVSMDEIQFSQHVAIHLDARPFKCGYCSFNQFRRSAVKNHIISSHPGMSEGNIINLTEALNLRNDLKLVHLDPQVRCIDVLGMSSECFEETLVEADVSVVDLYCVPNEKFAALSQSFGLNAVKDIDTGSEENDHFTQRFESKKGDKVSFCISICEDHVGSTKHIEKCLSTDVDSIGFESKIDSSKIEAVACVLNTSTGATVTNRKVENNNMCSSEGLGKEELETTAKDIVSSEKNTKYLTILQMTENDSDFHAGGSKTGSAVLLQTIDSLNSVDSQLKQQQNKVSSCSQLPEHSKKTDLPLPMPTHFDQSERQRASSCEPQKKRKAESNIDAVHACQKIKRSTSADDSSLRSHFSKSGSTVIAQNSEGPITSNTSSKNDKFISVAIESSSSKQIDEATESVVFDSGQKPITNVTVDSLIKKSTLVQMRKRSGSVGHLKSSLEFELKEKTFKRACSAEPTVPKKKREVAFLQPSKEIGESFQISETSNEDHVTYSTKVTSQKSTGSDTDGNILQEKQSINAATIEKNYTAYRDTHLGKMRDSPNLFDRMQKTFSGDLSAFSNETDKVDIFLSNRTIERTKSTENNCDSDSDLSTSSKKSGSKASNIFDLFN